MVEIKTIKLSSKGQICIPKETRKEVNFKEGEKLVLIAKDHEIIIKKSKEMLNKLDFQTESMKTMLMSKDSLKKDWDNDYDDRWNKY